MVEYDLLSREKCMKLVGRHRWSSLLALPFCFAIAAASSQSTNQHIGQFQGQGTSALFSILGAAITTRPRIGTPSPAVAPTSGSASMTSTTFGEKCPATWP
jgi:hypothetical protein